MVTMLSFLHLHCHTINVHQPSGCLVAFMHLLWGYFLLSESNIDVYL